MLLVHAQPNHHFGAVGVRMAKPLFACKYKNIKLKSFLSNKFDDVNLLTLVTKNNLQISNFLR